MPIVDIEQNSEPDFTHSHNYLAKVGEVYELTLTAEDLDDDQLSFRGVFLPEWLSIVEQDATSISLSGTPTEDDLGINFFSTEVSDGKQANEEHYALFVQTDDASETEGQYFSVFGEKLSALTVQSAPEIEISGSVQPYSSLDIVFSLAGADVSTDASDFTFTTTKALPEKLTVQYSTTDEYTGIISVQGSIENIPHQNTLVLTSDAESYELDVSFKSFDLTLGNIVFVSKDGVEQTPDISTNLVSIVSNEDITFDVAESGSFDFSTANLSENVSFQLELPNSSQAITLTDAILQLEYIVNITEFNDRQLLAADVNGDGAVTLTDAISNLEVIVNIKSAPNCVLMLDGASEYELNHGQIYDFEAVVLGDVNASVIDLI
jgi:hypothetical protein